VTEPRQAGTLARTHEGQPGLPRGRSRLPPQDVRASQRQRLLRSVIAVVSESGYYPITVADIVRRARVSRGAFYEHFANKEKCFLAATDEGFELMLARAQGLTYEQIAQELSLAPNTVKTHMARALNSIKDFLRKHGEIYLLLLLMGR